MALTYLAGYDGSEHSRAAVRLTRRLGDHMGARVIAVHIYEPVPFVAGKGHSASSARSLLEDGARQAAERLLAELAEQGVETRAVAALSAPRGLQQLAESERASLLAVGAKGGDKLGRLVPGTTADRMLHGAPCPVAVVPAATGEKLATVAVAYDGGEEARAALGDAQAVAARAGARLLLLAAIDPDAVPAVALLGAVTEVHDRLREGLERRLAEAREQLPPGLEAEAHVVDGVGAPAILLACDTMGVDLLVCGSRGYGPIRSVLLGSFSRYLVDHARCPVCVVPRSAAAHLDRSPGEPVAAHA
jgi:nucleotide-binding universal stress UspA family protein